MPVSSSAPFAGGHLDHRARPASAVGSTTVTTSASAISRRLRAISCSGSSPVVGQQLLGDPRSTPAASAGAGGLLVQPGVVDRDARGGGERRHQLLVLGGELAAGRLGQVEVAEHLRRRPGSERRGSSSSAGGRPGSRPIADASAQRGRSRIGRGSSITAPSSPLPARERADASTVSASMPTCDELAELAVRADHAQRAVAGRPARTPPPRSGAARRQPGRRRSSGWRRSRPRSRPWVASDVLGALDQLVEQFVEFEPRTVDEFEPTRCRRRVAHHTAVRR